MARIFLIALLALLAPLAVAPFVSYTTPVGDKSDAAAQEKPRAEALSVSRGRSTAAGASQPAYHYDQW
jgi:hypothetical protein